PDGDIRLSPLFDFAPMRLGADGIVKSTRWAAMRDTHRDSQPDWGEVCDAVFPDEKALADKLRDEIAEFADRLLDTPAIAEEIGIPSEVVDIAMRDCLAVAESVMSTCYMTVNATASTLGR